jgi:acyl carrier protein
MDKLLSELCEIFEVDDLPMGSKFEDIPNWDSLNALSVVALLDSNYGTSITVSDLKKFPSLEEFIRHVLSLRG